MDNQKPQKELELNGSADRTVLNRRYNTPGMRYFDGETVGQNPPVSTWSGPEPRELNTAYCDPWALSDRYAMRPFDANDPTFRRFVDTIRIEGQILPAIVRRTKERVDGHYRFEVIAGRRRYEACRVVGRPLRALVYTADRLDDRAAFQIMLAENDAREDISEFERALSFAKAMKEHVYGSQQELIDANQHRRYDKAIISRMLAAAELADMPAIWRHMEGRRDVPVRPAAELVRELATSPAVQQVAAERLKSVGERLTEMRTADIIRDIRKAIARSPKAAAAKGAKTIEISGSKKPLQWAVSADEVSVRFPRTALMDEIALLAAIRQLVDKARVEVGS